MRYIYIIVVPGAWQLIFLISKVSIQKSSKGAFLGLHLSFTLALIHKVLEMFIYNHNIKRYVEKHSVVNFSSQTSFQSQWKINPLLSFISLSTVRYIHIWMGELKQVLQLGNFGNCTTNFINYFAWRFFFFLKVMSG